MKTLILAAMVLLALAPIATADPPPRLPSKATNPEARLTATHRDGLATVPSMSGWNIEVVNALETGFAQGVCIIGDYAYLGFYGVISILDIANPASPVRAGFAVTAGQVIDFCHRGAYLYCGNYPENFLQIFDITNPVAPALVATIPVDGYRLDVEGNYLYAEDGLGVRVFDVTTPANPIPVGYIASSGAHSIYDVQVSANYLYVGRNASLQIVNVTNPSNPIQVSVLPVNGSAYVLASVSPQYLYSVTLTAPSLRIIDVSNPLAPIEVNSVSVGAVSDISLHENHAYLLDGDNGGQVHVFDVTDPLNPAALPSFSACGVSSGVFLGVGNDIAVVGDYSDGSTCFTDISQPASPSALGAYEPLPPAHSVDVSGGHLALSLQYGRLGWLDRYDFSPPTVANGHGGWIDGSQVVVKGNHAFVGMDDSQFGTSGFQIFDVSNPNLPVSAGYLETPWFPSPISVGSSHVYLTPNQSLWVVDVSNPWLPNKVGELAIAVNDVFASEPYLFATSSGSLRVIDVSNPTLPNVVASLPLGPNSYGLWVENSMAYVSTGAALWIVNVSSPLQPFVVGSFATNSLWTVRARGQFAYLSDYPFIRILDITNPSLPVEVGNIETFYLDSRIAVAPPYIYAATDYGPLLELRTPWITGVNSKVSGLFALKQNYPNPFNPSTTIAFETSSLGNVRLDVFDVRGQLVRGLVNESMPAGAHSVTWDGRDAFGNPARSGVYFYRLEANGKSEAKKMVILK